MVLEDHDEVFLLIWQGCHESSSSLLQGDSGYLFMLITMGVIVVRSESL